MVRPDLLISARCSHRVKQSELFDRWKSLQICKWAMDTSEANLFKYALPSVCLPAYLVAWVPTGTSSNTHHL